MTEGEGEMIGYFALIPAWTDLETIRRFQYLASRNTGELAAPLSSLEYLNESYVLWPGHIGYLALEWLIANAPNGILSLRTHCEALARGASVTDAFRAAFGVSKADFYSTSFPAYLEELRIKYGR